MKLFQTTRIYLKAVENEIALDSLVMAQMHEVQDLPFPPFVPLRPIQSVKYYQRAPHIFNFMYSLLLIAWPLIFFILTAVQLFFFMISCLIIKLLGSNQKDEWDRATHIGIQTTHKLKEQYTKLKLPYSLHFLVFSKKEMQENSIYYLHLLSPRIILEASFLSIISLIRAYVQLENKRDILQTYDAYKWLVRYLLLSRLGTSEKNIWSANHFDRWAILFDHLTSYKQRIWLQHGIIVDISLPHKLKNIDHAYVFNQHYIGVVQKNVIESKHVVFDLFNSEIKLTPYYEHITRKKVLLISHPIFVRKELEIIQFLSGKKEICLLVKPHPAYANYGLPLDDQEDQYLLIRKKEIYPLVDIVLSYQSTLAFEYEMAGLPVIFHDGNGVNDIWEKLQKSSTTKFAN